MLRFFWKSFLTGPACLGASLAMSAAVFAAESTELPLVPIPAGGESAESINLDALAQINHYSHGALQLAQVPYVSELSDVRPSDWAFKALQRLVKDYGCIEGFPNLTYRGNQTISRYEFAASLSACFSVIYQIGGSTPIVGESVPNDYASGPLD